MGPGQNFGDAVMFMDKPYPVTAEVLVDCMLLHVAKDVVFEGIDHDPVFARRMISGLILHELSEVRLMEVAGRSVSILDMEKLSSFEG